MRKSKKQKRKEKQEKLYNKRMIKKYPWLRPVKWGRRLVEIRDNRFDYSYLPIFNNMPGWWRAFGKMFCNEIQVLFKKNPDLYVLEYKEKWGGLRIDFEGVQEKVWGVAEKYETLSQHICFYCGKPDTPLTDTGWILPICKDCYEKEKICKKPYEEVALDDGKMKEEVKWKYLDGRELVISFSDTANKIRDWWKRHGA